MNTMDHAATLEARRVAANTQRRRSKPNFQSMMMDSNLSRCSAGERSQTSLRQLALSAKGVGAAIKANREALASQTSGTSDVAVGQMTLVDLVHSFAWAKNCASQECLFDALTKHLDDPASGSDNTKNMSALRIVVSILVEMISDEFFSPDWKTSTAADISVKGERGRQALGRLAEMIQRIDGTAYIGDPQTLSATGLCLALKGWSQGNVWRKA